jgi:peptide/nickel transport system permease protein
MSRGVGLLLPGLPQLFRGKSPEGGFALLLWLGLLFLVVVRMDRVTAALFGDLEDGIALLTLVVTLVGVWWWSFQENRRVGDGEAASRGATGLGWWSFRRNSPALLGLGVLCLLYLAMLLTPFLAPFEPEFREAFRLGGDMAGRLAPPSLLHLMGTDQFSQDVLTRILYGARVSLTIGLVAVGISSTLGTFLGAVAGYMGGVTDTVIMRLVDMVMAIPRLVILIAIVAFFPGGLLVVVVALAFTQWPLVTRIVRGEILALREREYAEAGRALGFGRWRILFRHLLPNAMGPLIVVAALGVGDAIVLEAGLSFLGLGVQAGTPSWGSMVSWGRDYLMDAWWIATFPGLSIVLAVVAFNLVGDGLRDALDPRQVGGAVR